MHSGTKSITLLIYLTKSISRYTGESFDYRLPIPNTPLQKEDCNQNSIDALVSDCKSGLREIPLVQIHHCYCEANKCADALTRRGPYSHRILFFS